jgi:glycosyltransferase involved in cell wall biosynthesis
MSSRVDAEIATSGMNDRIRFLGYVSPSDLPVLYAGADAFCFPSLYEGFGLPVLEAMACGTPVVASNRAAVPEVAGDAAILVDPTDPAAIGRALCRVLTDSALRTDLIAKGRQRAREFTWERTAGETIALLREVSDTAIQAVPGRSDEGGTNGA